MTHVSDLLTESIISPDGYKFLLYYRQEQSRVAGGQTYVKDFGTPLWTMEASTIAMPSTEALAFETKLETLDNGIGTFDAWDLRGPYPAEYSAGDFNDTGKIASIGSDRASLTLSGLPSGFKLSVGDYLSFTASGWACLHRITKAVTANASGTTPNFGVRPHLWHTATTGTSVKFKKPSTVMAIVPGSVSQSMSGPKHTAITFKAIQVLKGS